MTSEPYPMQIGFILSSLGLMRGGLETFGAQLVHRLARLGHAVTVMTGQWPGRDLTPTLADLPVHWVRVPCLPANHRLWQQVGQRRPGLPLKVQSLSFCCACRCHPAAKRITATYDVTLTALEIETVKFSMWRQRYARPNVSYFPGAIDLDWLRQDRSTVRLAISQTIAKHAREKLGLDIHGIVRPGIPDQWLTCDYSVRQRADRLLFVGRLEANKGVRDLIRIFHAVAMQMPDVRLRVVGDGPLRAWVGDESQRLGLSSRLTCLGSLPPERVRSELQNADLFVFPSHYESWGIAVLEAMGVGVPVLCSDIPALREATHGAARLLPLGKIATWVTTIRALLQNAPERTALSRSGRERARQMTWSRVALEMEGHLWRAAVGGA